MLAYILAIAIVLASLIFFFSAFFAPKLHRKDDFLWSGVGLFYGLVLWVCAGRITGGVLLGQMAAVTLVLSFGWQTISLRGAIANPEKIPNIKPFSLLDWLGGGLGKKKAKVKPAETTPVQPQPEVITDANEKIETVTDVIADAVPLPTQVSVPTQEIETVVETPEEEEVIQSETTVTDVEPAIETDLEIEDAIEDITVDEVAVEQTPPVTLPKVTTSPKTKKPNFFSRFFGKKQPTAKPESITSVLDAIDETDGDWEDSQNQEAEVDSVVEETATIEDNLETDTVSENLVVETETIAVVIEDIVKEETEDSLEEDWESEDFENFEETADEYAPTKIETASFTEVTITTSDNTNHDETNQEVIEVYQIETAVETISYELEPTTSEDSTDHEDNGNDENEEQVAEESSNPESTQEIAEKDVLEKVADLPNDNPDLHG